jgi:8-oxo-dGTP diphosphatase
MASLHPVPSVGLVVWRGSDVLLIKRGKQPWQGRWAIPGGRIERGEALHDAASRELAEETGVKAKIMGLIGVFESINEYGHFVMIDYAARWVSGDPVAGDDALAAEFVPVKQALERVAWDDTRLAIQQSMALIAPDC